MKRILVPVDFSETSANALSYAIQLFGPSSLEIKVLHIYGELSGAAFTMKNIDGVLKKDAKNQMDKLIQGLQKEYPQVSFKSQITKNDAVSAIISMGEREEFDFIVMGTNGASGLKEVFMGSVAGGVISKTSAPVIVVPSKYRFRTLDEIVFAYGDEPFSDATVAPMKYIVKEHHSKIKVLHIVKKKASNLNISLGPIADLNPSIDFAFATGDINKDLNDYLMKSYAGLLCMVRTKKGFMARLLNESVTLKQTFNSLVPLLILHD